LADSHIFITKASQFSLLVSWQVVPVEHQPRMKLRYPQRFPPKYCKPYALSDSQYHWGRIFQQHGSWYPSSRTTRRSL